MGRHPSLNQLLREVKILAELGRAVPSQTIQKVRGGCARSKLGSEVLRGLERTSPQRLTAGWQASSIGVESMHDILESFQCINDLGREGLEIFENSFRERGYQLQLSVKTLEASSVLGIPVNCGRSHHVVGLSKLAGAEVEIFHGW